LSTGVGQEAGGLVHAVAVDEGVGLGAGELVGDAAGKPALDVEGAVVEQPLRRLRQRRQLVQRDRDALDLRRAGFGRRIVTSVGPAAPVSVLSTSTSKAVASTVTTLAMPAARGGAAQHALDRLGGLRIDEVAALGIDRVFIALPSSSRPRSASSSPQRR
jgi:hypothetical protein